MILSVPHDHGQAHRSPTNGGWSGGWSRASFSTCGDAKTAYRVARDAALPSKDNYRVEQQFTAGWIALRFLNDPAAALAHFAKVAQGTATRSRSRAPGYWQGRAAKRWAARTRRAPHYEAAARYSDRLLRPDRARQARP